MAKKKRVLVAEEKITTKRKEFTHIDPYVRDEGRTPVREHQRRVEKKNVDEPKESIFKRPLFKRKPKTDMEQKADEIGGMADSLEETSK